MRLVWYVFGCSWSWRIVIFYVSLNEKQMFMLPTVVTMSISATRMYRDLADHLFRSDVCVILPFHHSSYSLRSTSLALWALAAHIDTDTKNRIPTLPSIPTASWR